MSASTAHISIKCLDVNIWTTFRHIICGNWLTALPQYFLRKNLARFHPERCFEYLDNNPPQRSQPVFHTFFVHMNSIIGVSDKNLIQYPTTTNQQPIQLTLMILLLIVFIGTIVYPIVIKRRKKSHNL